MINMLFNGVPVNIMALAGLVFAFIMTCLLLVKCNDRLPKDQGREFAVNGAIIIIVSRDNRIGAKLHTGVAGMRYLAHKQVVVAKVQHERAVKAVVGKE